jgi:hypothetical protein
MKPVTITFDVPAHLAPALRAAVELVSDHVGEKMTGPMESRKTQSYTNACIALGLLRKAVTVAVPISDHHIQPHVS